MTIQDRKEYFKKYYVENKDKIREKSRARYEAKKPYIREQTKKYRTTKGYKKSKAQSTAKIQAERELSSILAKESGTYGKGYTYEEDKSILLYKEQLGCTYKYIAEEILKRSIKGIEYRYNYLKKMRAKSKSNNPFTEIVYK